MKPHTFDELDWGGGSVYETLDRGKTVTVFFVKRFMLYLNGKTIDFFNVNNLMKFSKVRNERRKIYNLLRSASSLGGLSAWSFRPSAPVFVEGCVL